MAKKRTNIWIKRTVRFTPKLFGELYDYAKRYKVAMAPVAHFLLERAFCQPLDVVAYAEWLKTHDARPAKCTACGKSGHAASDCPNLEEAQTAKAEQWLAGHVLETLKPRT